MFFLIDLQTYISQFQTYEYLIFSSLEPQFPVKQTKKQSPLRYICYKSDIQNDEINLRNNSWNSYCVVSFNMGWQDISILSRAIMCCEF